MRKFRNFFVAAALIRCTSGYIGPEAQLQPPGFAADVAAGQGLYNRWCSSCHGGNARGIPALGSPDITGKSAVNIKQAIANVSLMQGLVSAVGASDIEHIAAYLKTLAPP